MRSLFFSNLDLSFRNTNLNTLKSLLATYADTTMKPCIQIQYRLLPFLNIIIWNFDKYNTLSKIYILTRKKDNDAKT